MYNVISNGNNVQSAVTEFVADTLNDIDTLPTTGITPGSDCIVLEDSSVWMLGNDKTWHQL